MKKNPYYQETCLLLTYYIQKKKNTLAARQRVSLPLGSPKKSQELVPLSFSCTLMAQLALEK